MRKHYMTLNFRNNAEITHMVINGLLHVNVEEAIIGGFKSCEFLVDGTLVSNNGYSGSELQFYKDFILRNAPLIIELSREES